MISIAITGGIGSGKSYISRMLEEYDIPIYNTDDEAKRLNLCTRLDFHGCNQQLNRWFQKLRLPSDGYDAGNGRYHLYFCNRYGQW